MNRGGVGDVSPSMDKPMTRAQMSAFINRIAKGENPRFKQEVVDRGFATFSVNSGWKLTRLGEANVTVRGFKPSVWVE